jgi:pimeloyl-ACP methyl ester carboxylesterase
MGTFILIHGACHGGWCWERVVPLLEAKGHRALAPDLPGMGQDKTPLETVTADLWNTFLADLIKAQAEPVVLVGHSRGGMQVTAAAEAVPDRIKRLVYLSAFVPKDGQANMELAVAHCSQALMAAGAQMRNHAGPGFPPEAARSLFYNTTEESWTDRALSKQCAEPPGPSMVPAHVTPERYGKVRKTYIECLEDQAITIEGQRRMQTHANFESVVSMATDHSPFYCAPDKLAEVLESLAA